MKVDVGEIREAIVSTLRFNAPVSNEIKDGVLIVTSSYQLVETEDSASTDNLDTITGFDSAQTFMLMRPTHDDHTVIIKHGTGNIICGAGADITLANESSLVLCIYDMLLEKWLVQPFDATSGASYSGGALDEAYDFGGAGAGRAVTVDAGAIDLTSAAANNHDTLQVHRDTATITADEGAFSAGVTGEANQRWRVYQDGLMEWGAGGASAADAFLARYGDGKLAITGTATPGGELAVDDIVEVTAAAGVTIDGLLIKDGAHGQITGTGDLHTEYVREADANWIDLTDSGATTLHTHAGGGVTDADYLVGTAHAGLSAEIVVGTSPGGELGGTWASPTVDGTHSGSAHHAEAHGIAAHTGHANWKALYTDGSGDEQELALGAAGTVFYMNGNAAPTATTLYQYKIHKFTPKEAPTVAIAADTQADLSMSGPVTETVVGIYSNFTTVGTGLTINLHYNSSGMDLDSVAWVEIDSNTHNTADGLSKSVTSAFTDSTIDPTCLIRMGIASVTGTYKDCTIFLVTKFLVATS